MNIEALAKEMNVKTTDVMSLMQMVVTSLIADGMKETIENVTKEERVEIIAAYTQSEVKKFKEFCESLLTNEKKKNALSLYVIKNLKNK